MSYNKQQLAAEVTRILCDNPRLSLATVCSILGVHRHTVEHACNAVAGGHQGFRSLKGKARLARSLELLRRSSTSSIKMIAFEMGYKSPRSFCRFIKRSTGVSPTLFRRRAFERGQL